MPSLTAWVVYGQVLPAARVPTYLTLATPLSVKNPVIRYLSGFEVPSIRWFPVPRRINFQW